MPRSNVIGLLHFLQSKIACVDGCYFWASNGKVDDQWRFTPDVHFPDRTGIEWSRNKIHPLDIWEPDWKVESKPGIHNLVLGLIVADVLRLKFHLPVSGRAISDFGELACQGDR